MDSTYLCIDLKSFYASVECVDRGLDPLVARLVVADPSRGDGAICLAITPALKKMGIHNRCRIFEIPTHVKYITALPRMKRYMEMSAEIYKIYLRYISKEDIHVYSIDECFLDVTRYLNMYQMTAKELASVIMNDVLNSTGITATCGIGTNLFLSKLALDIISKHAPDNIGVLDEESFKKEIWHHKPITDIWNISTGTELRLLKYGVDDLYGVTQIPEEKLYKEFGVNAELLIDHANGIETTTIKDIHSYKPKNNSLSNSQILFEDYKWSDALLVMKEMVDLLCLEAVDKHIVTNHLSLMIGYAGENFNDYRENNVGISHKLVGYTNSRKKIMDGFIKLFNELIDKTKSVRSIGLTLGNIIPDDYASIDLFTNEEEESKERRVQEALNDIRRKFGKNSVLKAMNLEKNATTIKRNKLIGGHNSGEDD